MKFEGKGEREKEKRKRKAQQKGSHNERPACDTYNK
jgi:hypothetical protein